MDPSKPETFNHRTDLLSTGRTYHFVDQVPENYKHGETPVLLLLHGFPDLWYAWRNQIGPWCRHGWRVIAPDMLGYGGTSKPYEASEYTTDKISKDLSALLDFLTLERVIVIGHDWGSYAAGKFCQWQGNRVQAVAMLAAPLIPRLPVFLSLEAIAEKLPDWNYMVFMASDRSPALFDKNTALGIDILFRSSKTWIKGITSNNGLENVLESGEAGRGDLLNDEELAYYTQNLEGGFRGPTNWYRAFELSWQVETVANVNQVIPTALPAVFVQPMEDPTAPQGAIDAMKTIVPGLEIIQYEGAGHWILLDRADDVSRDLMAWIDKVLEQKGKL
ncbi:alpha/beta-hydrolase [Dacryopinax primogenitus]|uniref:Alpha/beta-hydrolase n=1 Tax=Dacryopinax primogenitus (strain DJM 731) TaxID=1858805 RepID=M5GGZ8_DACPD|nr:alpha/beta-hydrolase [Dacryopinax primogenitus]EJU06363.1 alpha/beta-hydrolase [Dacryopinax primogenitus]